MTTTATIRTYDWPIDITWEDGQTQIVPAHSETSITISQNRSVQLKELEQVEKPYIKQEYTKVTIVFPDNRSATDFYDSFLAGPEQADSNED